jgi:hypothetical protein
MKLPSSNTIFLVIASLVVAGGVYWYFFTGSPTSDQSVTAGTTENLAQARFDTLTSELGPITFDLTILTDPRFTALVDLATPIEEEPIGRKDPFAPVPGVSTQ